MDELSPAAGDTGDGGADPAAVGADFLRLRGTPRGASPSARNFGLLARNFARRFLAVFLAIRL
jgi:hypothetical protein